MTVYAVFDRDANRVPAVVPERFSWFAAFLPPVFAIVHGLWLELVAYVILLVLLSLSSDAIGDGAAFWIYVVFAVWIGFEAATLRRGALRRAGWRHSRDVIAASDDQAALEGLRDRRP
jgi:hypothetical protein